MSIERTGADLDEADHGAEDVVPLARDLHFADATELAAR